MPLHQFPVIKRSTMENITETDCPAHKNIFLFAAPPTPSVEILLSPLFTSYSREILRLISHCPLIHSFCRGRIIKRLLFPRGFPAFSALLGVKRELTRYTILYEMNVFFLQSRAKRQFFARNFAVQLKEKRVIIFRNYFVRI